MLSDIARKYVEQVRDDALQRIETLAHGLEEADPDEDDVYALYPNIRDVAAAITVLNHDFQNLE